MIGFVLLAAGALAWLAAGLYYSLPFTPLAGLALIAGGFTLAAWAAREPLLRRAYAAAGLGLAFVGMLLFLDRGLFELANVGLVASHLFALALLGALAGLYVGERWLPRASWTLAAFAALLWVYNDRAAFVWQPGNAAALVGAAWVALRPTA